MFATDGDEVRIENPANAKATLEILVIAGVPLNEPIARYGPFVMNTRAELLRRLKITVAAGWARLNLDDRIGDGRTVRFLSNDKKLIAVIGATGRQGGGVLRALQASGQFKVRALTRDPEKHGNSLKKSSKQI